MLNIFLLFLGAFCLIKFITIISKNKDSIPVDRNNRKRENCRDQTEEEIEIEKEEFRKMTKVKKGINYGCTIAGLEHHQLYLCSKNLSENSTITLHHECNNPVDYFAVAIYYKKYMLGYVPAMDCRRIAVRLKNGIKFQSHIENIYESNYNGFTSIRVRIVEIPKSTVILEN